MAGRKSDRELIDTGTDKRYVRRDDVGRSLSQDVKRDAKTEVKSGQGDRGDRKKK